jgi:hypothetical protein
MSSAPDLELGEARAAIDRSDARAALKRLDRARRGYLKNHDREGLEHVLHMTELVGGEEDERARTGRENLAYAVKQNLRQETRRDAQAAGEHWQDPYPALQAPTEHTGIHLGHGAKIAIGVGVAIGTLAVAAYVVAVVAFALWGGGQDQVTLRLLNDTTGSVTVTGCDDTNCGSTWMHRDVGPGQGTERSVPIDDLVDLFKIERPGSDDTCLPVRVHDGYRQLGGQTSMLVVRISQATPCPGTTVLPEPAAPAGL